MHADARLVRRPRAYVAPDDPLERRRWFRTVADAIASAGVGSSAVVEWSTSDAPVRVVLRPNRLLQGLDHGPTGPSTDEERRPPSPSTSFWEIRTARPSGGAAPALPCRELIDLRARTPHVEALAAQTYWVASRDSGRIWVARRLKLVGPPDLPTSLAQAIGEEWSTRVRAATELVALSDGASRAWALGDVRPFGRAAWSDLAPTEAAATAVPEVVAAGAVGALGRGHSAVFGATGAGKTWFLAQAAADAVRAGRAVLVVDLHGDLAPSLAARLAPRERDRLVAVDIEAAGTPGIAAFHGDDDRAAAHLVAAVKRLSPDGADVYWGFRLERLFDVLTRLVLEEGGSLLDLYALLTDPVRRDAARLATRRREIAGFLDELAPIVKRNPEFLWSATARLSKVVLVPELRELLAPVGGGLPLEALLAEGRPVVVRLPFARVGPEAATFAASLVLARAYFGSMARASGGRRAGVLAVLDEVQGLSPRLVAEMLGEGRKFGFSVLFATQFPDRLAPELRQAASASVREVVVFRVPSASAPAVGPWLGLAAMAADAVVGRLAPGVAVRRSELTGDLLAVAPGRPRVHDPGAWAAAVRGTCEEFPATAREFGDLSANESLTERILLAVLAAEEGGAPVPAGRCAEAVAGLPGPPMDGAGVEDRVAELERRGSLERRDGRFLLSHRGARELGLTIATGATRESGEHRALLLRAFRLFARRGYRLEIVRQGRFDTTLPDARLRLLAGGAERSPRLLAEQLARARPGWAWRFFGGRDVHVEAEVSGAVRADRIRRGVGKALRHDAFPLFVVSDAARAARVRRTLRAMGLGPDQAQVWTLGARTDRGGPQAGAVEKPPETP
jgi:hypothetical protein